VTVQSGAVEGGLADDHGAPTGPRPGPSIVLDRLAVPDCMVKSGGGRSKLGRTAEIFSNPWPSLARVASMDDTA